MILNMLHIISKASITVIPFYMQVRKIRKEIFQRQVGWRMNTDTV